MPRPSATFNVGVTPASLAISPDGRVAYVANSNEYGIPGSDTVTVLDLRKGLVKGTIRDSSFDGAYRIVVDRRGKFGYVTNSNSPSQVGGVGTVSIVDLRGDAVVGVIEGFDGATGIVLSRTRAYVTNYGADGGVQSGNGKTVSVVDLATRKVVGTVVVDQAPVELALSPDHRLLYVICYVDGKEGTGTMNVIDTRSLTVVGRITGFFGPSGIVLGGEGGLAYVTNFGSNDFAPYGTTMSVVDLAGGRIVKNVELGIQPSGIALSADGKFVYVSNYNTLYASPGFKDLTPGEGTVNVVRVRDHTVVGRALPVGRGPSTLALLPGGEGLFVCNYIQNTVSVFRLDWVGESDRI